MAYPRCPAIKKQRLHGNGEGQRFYFSTGKPSFLGPSWSRKRGVWTFFCISYSKSRKSKRLGPMVSCILFLCFPVCLSHGLQLFFLFGGLGNMNDAKRCNKMETISTSCAFELDTGGPVLPVGAVPILFARSQRWAETCHNHLSHNCSLDVGRTCESYEVCSPHPEIHLLTAGSSARRDWCDGSVLPSFYVLGPAACQIELYVSNTPSGASSGNGTSAQEHFPSWAFIDFNRFQ